MKLIDNESRYLVARLFRENFRNHQQTYFLSIIFMVFAALSTAATAWLMRDIINKIFVSQELSLIGGFAAIIILVSAIRGLSTYVYTVLLAKIGNAITSQFQKRLISKILSMKVSYISKKNTSQFIVRISQNARSAQQVFIMISTTLGRDLITVVLLIGVMLSHDIVLTAVAFLVLPPALLGVSSIVKKLRSISSDEIGAMDAVVGATQDALHGFKAVKSFRLEDEMEARVQKAAGGLEDKANRVMSVQASTGPLMETLGGVSIGLVLLYAGWQTTSSETAPGEFMAFIAAFLLAYEPAKRLARLHTNLQRPLKAVAKLYKLLDADEVEGIIADAKNLDISQVAGKVEFRNVNFGYSKERQILNDASFVAQAGKVTALIGESGIGKTTVFSLLQRFYEPSSGQIEIDGKDIKLVPVEQLRDAISYVGQETHLFSGTIADNIGLGKIGASNEEILVAAKAAYISEFINELPDGFNTIVAESGSNFSGGQRQRIAIARALLKNAPILILDEATSALDNKSESIVKEAMSNLMAERTTIIIAHRMSSIDHADQVFSVEDGKINPVDL
ncbi:MAG: ABC transporter ATP-binding protein [Hyphomicrobiales bacterium]